MQLAKPGQLPRATGPLRALSCSPWNILEHLGTMVPNPDRKWQQRSSSIFQSGWRIWMPKDQPNPCISSAPYGPWPFPCFVLEGRTSEVHCRTFECRGPLNTNGPLFGMGTLRFQCFGLFLVRLNGLRFFWYIKGCVVEIEIISLQWSSEFFMVICNLVGGLEHVFPICWYSNNKPSP